MNQIGRDKYLSEFKSKISKLPHEEYEDAVNYFVEYIEDSGLESYEDICKELGTPREAASELMVGLLKDKNARKRNPSIVLIAILAILSAPVSIPIFIFLITILFAIVMLIVAIFIASIAGVVGGGALAIKTIIVSIGSIGIASSGGMILFGISLIAIGLIIPTILLMVKLIQWLVQLIAKLYYRIMRRNRHE